MKRRAIGVAAVVAVTAWLVFGLVPAASAVTVTGSSGDFTLSADDSDVPAGASVTGYTGAGGAVVIPDTVVIGANTYNVTSIGDNAFESKPVTSVSIPSTVTGIGAFAFDGTDLTSIDFGTGVTEIGTGAFQSVVTLTSVTIPSSVTTIDDGAFFEDALTSVTFNEGLTSIGVHAFFDNQIHSVQFPSTLTFLGSGAFDDNGLTHATFLGPAPSGVVGMSGLSPSLGATPLTVNYPWRYGPPEDTSVGAFSTPTWFGYNTVPIVTLSFNLDAHGGAVANQEFPSGETPTRPADPTASGHTFLGWFTDSTLTTKFDFADPATTDETAFAGWSTLAETGVAINPFVIPSAIAVVVIGALLILLGRSRARLRARKRS